MDNVSVVVVAALFLVAVVAYVWPRRRRGTGRGAAPAVRSPAVPAAGGGLRAPVVSPDNRWRVAFSVYEVKMSLWIETPVVLDNATGKPLLDLCTSDWSADEVQWRADSKAVAIHMRHYPGDAPTLTVVLDLPSQSCRVESPAETATVSFAQINGWLEDWYRRNQRH